MRIKPKVKIIPKIKAMTSPIPTKSSWNKENFYLLQTISSFNLKKLQHQTLGYGVVWWVSVVLVMGCGSQTGLDKGVWGKGRGLAMVVG